MTLCLFVLLIFRTFPWYLWWLSLSSAALDKKLWKNGSEVPPQSPTRFSESLFYSFSYEESSQPWTWSRGESVRCKVWCLLNPVFTGHDSSSASSDDAFKLRASQQITSNRWRNRKLFLIGINWISINQARNFENIDSGVSQPKDTRRLPKWIKLL